MAELSKKQLAALRKGRAIRKANVKAAKAKAPKKPAQKTGKKPASKPRAPSLSPQEREGMGLVCDLVNAQFAADGSLRNSSAWVRGLSDSQRRALVAADRRIRKAAGR